MQCTASIGTSIPHTKEKSNTVAYYEIPNTYSSLAAMSRGVYVFIKICIHLETLEDFHALNVTNKKTTPACASVVFQNSHKAEIIFWRSRVRSWFCQFIAFHFLFGDQKYSCKECIRLEPLSPPRSTYRKSIEESRPNHFHLPQKNEKRNDPLT